MDPVTAINLRTKGWILSSTESLKKHSHPDDLINAWELGVQKGLDLKETVIKDYYIEKASKALEAATQLF